MLNKPILPGYSGGKTNPYQSSVDFIISHEGRRMKNGYHVAYQNKGDVPTIGYGTTNPKWVNKGRITEAEARQALMEDIVANEKHLQKLFAGYNDFPDSAKDALRDIIYNIGEPKLRLKSPNFMAAMRRGDLAEAMRQMDWGNNQEGFENGLTARNADRQQKWMEAFGDRISSQSSGQQLGVQETSVPSFEEMQWKPTILRVPKQYNEQPHQGKYQYIDSNQGITNNQITIPWEFIEQNTPNFMPPLDQLLTGFSGGKSGIHIKPSTRGTFTAAAKSRGMGVQQFASKVLSNPNNYSSAMRKKAQFAHNAAGWKH